MATEDVQVTLEQVSEDLVLAEVSDMQALAKLHTLFEEVTEWGDTHEQPEVAAAGRAVGELLEAVILGENDNPESCLETIAEAVAGLQSIIRDGHDPRKVAFPTTLGVVGPQGEAQEVPGAGGAFSSRVLPAFVDEAIFSEFLARQGAVLEELEALILKLESQETSEDLDAFRRLVHTLKGESALLGLNDVESLCHKVEDALEESSVAMLVDPLLAAKDWLGRMFDACQGKGKEPEPVGGVMSQLLGEAPQASAVVPAKSPAAREAKPAGGAPAATDSELPQTPMPLTGDLELMSDFVVEAGEHLDLADVHLLTLETEPGNKEAINAVFRGVHTIKGVTGFLGLAEILALAHEMETLLDKSRKGELALEGASLDVVFDALDFLKRLLKNVSIALESGSLLDVEPDLPALLDRIRAVGAGDEGDYEVPEPAQPGQRLGELLVETGCATSEAVERALEEQGPVHLEVGEILVRNMHLSRKQVDEALAQQKENPEMKLGLILVERGYVTQDALDAALEKQAENEAPRLGELLYTSGATSAKDVAGALRRQSPDRREGERRGADGPTSERREGVKVRESLKVDASRLDHLVDTIGELVIAESMVAQSPELCDDASPELQRHINLLDKITRELQEMGTSLRMVPVRTIFQRMARLVRDLAKKSGKKVNFAMVGEETELDKSVVDKIGDPLVHMIRNAVDHGIEDAAQDRLDVGKQAAARVELRAFHKGGSIYIEVEDDGRGLNREAIVNKALERGIVQNPEALSDREVWNLIFEPGFSTAAKVTDVSGRGVGMDVVKRNIEALRGQVDIHSEQGVGSTFSIRLPLTLAIIDGMVVRVGPERYIIPTLSIVMSLRPRESDVSSVIGRGEMLSLKNELIPLFRLSELFYIQEAACNLRDAIVMVVENEGLKVAFMLDEILGQQQTVIKSLGEGLSGTIGIAGGAIMPDGEVGLILDIGGLVRLAHDRGGERLRTAVEAREG